MKTKYGYSYWQSSATRKEVREIWIIVITLTIAVLFIAVAVLMLMVSSAKANPLPTRPLNGVYSVPNPCGLADIICPDEIDTGLLNAKTVKSLKATVYGYSSSVDETDASPFITASGYNLNNVTADNIFPIANNCLDFGTKVTILNKTYTVLDRMNKRYGCDTFDIWFGSKAEARKWGKKIINVNL